MIISIFSKFHMCGGSERRAVELANGLVTYSGHFVRILCSDDSFPDKLNDLLDDRVEVCKNSLSEPEMFYTSDVVLVINTDSKDFCTMDYWEGKTVSNHKYVVDMTKMSGKIILFLFNFLVSPARHLWQFEQVGIKTVILTTNTKFFRELSEQDRYERVQIIPRFVLNSPIGPSSVKFNDAVGTGTPITIASFSKRSESKWNAQIADVVKFLSEKYGSNVQFNFMGVTESIKQRVWPLSNCLCLSEGEMSVGDFLDDADVFLFFPDWKREEPWARVVAEAMTAGLPIIATDKGGNKDQIVHGNNGFLCKDYDRILSSLMTLIERPEMISKMGRNSRVYSHEFSTPMIISKLMGIIGSV